MNAKVTVAKLVGELELQSPYPTHHVDHRFVGYAARVVPTSSIPRHASRVPYERIRAAHHANRALAVVLGIAKFFKHVQYLFESNEATSMPKLVFVNGDRQLTSPW